MLVCPQCEFENPSVNKFCQECGVSLTEKPCPTCGNRVPLQVFKCDCGTVTGKTWWAIVTTTEEVPEVASTEAASTEAVPAIEVTAPLYLDAHQRYQLLAPLVQTEPTVREGLVLDCQPLQRSPLKILFDAASLETEKLGAAKLDDQALEAVMIPTGAQVYLELESQFSPIVPPLHDAWQQDKQEILLLADRSALPLLPDWQPPEEGALLEILGWLETMLDLWVALEPWRCRQSLLILSNLSINPTSDLCLRRLYEESQPLALPALGEIWQTLLSEHLQVRSSELFTLIDDLRTGKIEHPETVRSHLTLLHSVVTKAQIGLASANTLGYSLKNIDSVQVDSTPSAMMPDPKEISPTPLTSSADLLEAPALSTDLDLEQTEPTLPDELDSVDTPPSELNSNRESEGDDMPTVVLPMQLFSLEDAGRTDIGRQREHNEDNFGIETQAIKSEQPSGKTVRARGLYILCDGMGGHASGEVASALAVDTLKQYFQLHWQDTPLISTPSQPGSKLPSADVIREGIQQANKAIYDVNQQAAQSGSGRMGTTLVVALLHNTEVAIAHVGDSRLYRYTRKYGLEQLTVDHEVGQREIQRGVEAEIAYSRPDAYQLTQALGPRNEDFIQPDIQFLELNEDTLILLASDGLTDNDLLETYWQTHVDPMMSSQMNLEKGLGQLIDLANQHNGHDNITAIAIRAKVRPNLDNLR